MGGGSGGAGITPSTGIAQPYYSGSAPSGVNLELSLGSAASPVTTVGPNLRISRTEDIDGTAGGGTNLANEKNAALVLLSSSQGSGVAGDKMQACGLFVFAKASGSGNWDAVAINAVGKSTGSATRRGTGAYFEGLKDTDATILGVELRSNNQQASNVATDSDYNTNGLSNTAGLWVACSSHASANPKHGAGIQVGRSGTTQWGVGLGFVQNAVVDQSIRDDSSSTTSFLVQGTHTYGVDLQGATISGAAMRVPNAVSLKWRNAANSGDLDAITVNSSNELAFGVTASQITLVRFHRSLALQDSVNLALGTSTGTKIGTSTAQKLALWNATPVVQPTAVADATDAATAITQLNALLARMRTIGAIAA